MREDDCLACHGTGMQSDDEGWQYRCSVCHGTGKKQQETASRIMATDENNRLLD